MRVLVALTTTLLCSIPLYSSGASLAGTPSRPIGDKCFSHKAIGVSSTVCDFAVGQPFLLRGYSKGGPSTLSYTVQCGNDPSWPMSRAAIDRRVWYKRSLTVKGNFKVYGTKDTLSATRHCAAARGKAALLSVKLKMSKRVTRTNLVVRLDSSLPWGE